ncbi:ESPR-type extended signal peptide-containing protein, partial [Psychrobacter sp.]|uniref:ESPR domain-containing protein n=1 Tax=Psychrobacter sp. TaxID=56811 RepID=UPI0035664453
MNRIYKVIWNEALNCFTAVGEYAKARGKSSKSSVSANATINTTDNLSSTSAFKLTAIGLGLIAAGFCMQANAINPNPTSGNSNHHDGTYSHSHGSHGVHAHVDGNNSHKKKTPKPSDPIILNFEGDIGPVIPLTEGETLNVLGGVNVASELSNNPNIGVVANGDTLTVKLAKDLTGLTSVTTGNTVMNTSGVSFLGGSSVKLSGTGLNNGGNQITNVASGGAITTNAANIGDVKSAVAAGKTKYYSVNSTGGTND